MTDFCRHASRIIVAILAFAASCTPAELDWQMLTGRNITFNAIATPGAAETKTVYSGQMYSVGTTARYERVNWAVGDTIRIVSPNCPEGFADYAVAEVSGDTNQNSSAQINPATGNGHGLTWGEGAHDFYAVYPAPGTKGTAAGLSFSGGTSATFPIPAVQAFPDVETSTVLTRMLPDMNYAYMYAATRVSGPSASVNMEFKPLFTAFEITVGSDGENELDLYSFYMTAAQDLSGTYSVSMNAEDGSWTLGTVTGGTSRIDVSLGGTEHPTKVSKDKALTFTVFAIPQATLSGIVLHFETGKGARTLELKYSNGDWIEVSAGQKAFIEGLKIPGTIRFYTIEPIANLDFWGVGATSGKFSVRSYSRNLAGIQRNEKWKIEYSTDYSESSQSGTWFTTPTLAGAPWLGVTGASLYDGSEETLTASIAAQSTSSATNQEHGEIQDIRTAILKATPSVPANYDLSMHTVHGDSRSLPVTSNCYVVKAPGTYVFPIVYGNAIDGTKSDALQLDGVGKVINKEAYWPSDSKIPATAQYFLKRFFNADNVPITSPFVIDDLRTSGSITNATPLDAIALWQDGSYTDPVLSGTPAIVDGPASSPLNGKCKFITFTIDQANIRQGNIVIALRDVSAGSDAASARIVWSWMIWVTDEDLHAQEMEMQSGSVQLMPVNVGWSDIQGTVERYDYDERSCYVRITQVDDGGNPLTDGASSVFKALQHKGIGFTFYEAGESVPGYGTAKAYLGSSPYYQYGRKDPFIGRDYTSGTNARNIKFIAASGYTIDDGGGEGSYMVNYDNTLKHSSGDVDLGLAIRKPYVFYHSETHYYSWYGGKDIDPSLVQGLGSRPYFHNLWNAFTAGLGDDAKVRKTVYDPCPPDYCLPRLNSFSAFTIDGNETANVSRINGTFDSARNGWNFYRKRMNGTTKDDTGGSMFFCKTGLRREGSLNGTYRTWGAYWTAERKVNGTYDLAEHLVLRNSNSVEPFYFNTAGGYLADSWSIRPALEETW